MFWDIEGVTAEKIYDGRVSIDEYLMKLEKCRMTFNGRVFYFKKLVIYGIPGLYSVHYWPTLMQRIKARLDLYPSSDEVRAIVRREMLGEA